MTSPQNPLDTPEVSETNIAELFALAGPDLVEAEQSKLRSIVEAVRAKRHIWEHEENSAKKSGRRPNPNKGLKLAELDIDLTNL